MVYKSFSEMVKSEKALVAHSNMRTVEVLCSDKLPLTKKQRNIIRDELLALEEISADRRPGEFQI